MRVAGRFSHSGRASLSFLLALVLIATLLPATLSVAAQTDGEGIADASPETTATSIDDLTAGDETEIEIPASESTDVAVSLVVPSQVIVDSTTSTTLTDPCRAIDPAWIFIAIDPQVDLTWIDPNTGLGGGIALDPEGSGTSFGWDSFGGGAISGVIVPNWLDDPAVAANFYDYRSFAGAVASDRGLTSPNGTLTAAYLCIPAPPKPVEEHTAVPSATATAAESSIDPTIQSTGSPVDATVEDAIVAPAAIGTNSVVKVAEPLNLRISPGITADVIAVLAAGTIVTVIGGPQSASGYTWWQLSTPSGTGWSVADYLIEQVATGTVTVVSTSTRTPTRTPTVIAGGIGIGSAVQVLQRLNLRALPSTSGTVIAVMPAGTIGTVVEGPRSANGYVWWRMSTSLGTGWAAATYLAAASGTVVSTATNSPTPSRTATNSVTPSRTATTTGTHTPTATVTQSATSSSTVPAGLAIGDLVRTTTRLNLRSAAGTQATVITVLANGAQGSVIDGPTQATGSTWWKLQTTSGPGWVAGQYLTKIGVAPTATNTRTPTISPTASMTRTATVSPTRSLTPTITTTPASCGAFGYGDIVRANESVNFRSQPSTSGTIIRTLAAGERGTVKGGPTTANGFTWCQIQVGATTGWVAAPYLTRVSGPVPTPNGTTTPRPDPPDDPGNGSASVVYQGSSSSGMIALTFDAGADRGMAAYILDVLQDYGVHASFGMTGTWARDNPDLVQRMVSEGHQLINHTWDHPSFTGGSSSTTVLTRSGRLDQLARAEAVVEDETGYQMSPYWRPPYGDISASALSDVYAGGYYVTVMWSCDTLAWNGATEQQILNRCMYPSGAGDIILMHVGADGLDWAVTADMIEYFQGQGLQIVTVEELLGG